ncbi:MAG: dihydrodipicolinate synthase family protein [Proteobacteria bacterium]|nr:dihydrodipicolinate synthase family protein [Pseudomonadota bacterium]MBI3499316.1 dihydrodipicolinate synthase family protein [Pseudomonadota bacterium]
MTARPPSSSGLEGVFAAVATPVDAAGRVDHGRFADHCRWLLAEGCHGLTPWGTSGESTSFTVEERMDALDRLVAAGIQPKMMAAGTGAAALGDAVKLTRHAVGHGVAGVLVLPSFYFKDQVEDGIFGFFAEIIDKVGDSGLRLYLYNIPQLSGVPISLAVVKRLRQRFGASVAGIKDSSGDWTNTQAYLKELPGLSIMTGNEPHLLQTLKAGGTGTICGMANFIPRALRRLYDRRGEADAAKLQADIAKTQPALFDQPVIASLKHAIAVYRGDPGWRRMKTPLAELSAKEAETFEAKLRASPLPPLKAAAAAQ